MIWLNLSVLGFLFLFQQAFAHPVPMQAVKPCRLDVGNPGLFGTGEKMGIGQCSGKLMRFFRLQVIHCLKLEYSLYSRESSIARRCQEFFFGIVYEQYISIYMRMNAFVNVVAFTIDSLSYPHQTDFCLSATEGRASNIASGAGHVVLPREHNICIYLQTHICMHMWLCMYTCINYTDLDMVAYGGLTMLSRLASLHSIN